MARWSHSRPKDIACMMSGGDAAFVSGDGARLVNGNPGAISKLTWRTGSQTLTTEVDFDLSFGAPIQATDIGLFGCTLPAGTLVNFSLKRAGDTGYPYNPTSQRLFARPHGENVAVSSMELGLDPIVGARIAIPNNVNGVASIVPGQTFTLGELWVGEGAEPDIDVAFQDENQDSTSSQDLDLWQDLSIRGTVRRVRTFTPANNYMPRTIADLIARSDRRKRIVHIPFRLDAAGAYSGDLVNDGAIFGVLTKVGLSKHLDKRLFGFGDLTLTEIPIPT